METPTLPPPNGASTPYADLDHALHAMAASVTQGLSPSSLTLAWLDWLLHLLASPGTQLALAAEARDQVLKLQQAIGQGGSNPVQVVTPAPGDHRFDAPAWRQWPFNLLEQNFLLCEQWWRSATTGVRGVSTHHAHVVAFGARQWLDLMAPSNFFLTNPEALSAAAREGGASIARGAAHLLEDIAHGSNGTQEAAATFKPGAQVALTPGTVVYRNHLIELIQYTPATRTVHPEPVLIVPSWIMKFYILDLSPHNSLVRYLVEQGFTVFMLSWRNPDAADRALGMDDYLQLGPIAALTQVQRIVPAQHVHGVGYCLGGTLLAIAAAAWARDGADHLASLTLLASETDFEQPGDLAFFIDDSQVAYLDDLMWEQGYLDGRQMGDSFTFLNARDLFWSRMVRDYLLGTRAPLNDLTAWSKDVTRMPYRMHTEYLRSLYLDNALAHGTYKVGDRPVALSDIHVPVFLVGTEKDHISPWRSVYKLHLLSDTEITFVLTSGGHNAGIVSEPWHAGRSYRVLTREPDGQYVDPDRWLAQAQPHEGSWWAEWTAWLAQRSGRRVAARAIASAGRARSLGEAPGTYVAG